MTLFLMSANWAGVSRETRATFFAKVDLEELKLDSVLGSKVEGGIGPGGAPHGDGGTAPVRVGRQVDWGEADAESLVFDALTGGVFELNDRIRVFESASLEEFGVSNGRSKRTWFVGV